MSTTDARGVCLDIYYNMEKEKSGNEAAADRTFFEQIGTSSTTMAFYDLVDRSLMVKISMLAEAHLGAKFTAFVHSVPAKIAAAVIFRYVVAVFYYLDMVKDIFIVMR